MVAVRRASGEGEPEHKQARGKDVGGGFDTVGHGGGGARRQSDGDFQDGERRTYCQPGERDASGELIGLGHEMYFIKTGKLQVLIYF